MQCLGDAVLGARPAPFPSPLPPASGSAGPVRSLGPLLWTCSEPVLLTASSVFGPVNFLSLSCYPTV